MAPVELATGNASSPPSPTSEEWEYVSLPHLGDATEGLESRWYQLEFDVRHRGDARQLIHFDGSFYFTDVWLNGAHLGNHEGYFQPFAFDVTDDLLPGRNLLQVACTSPIEAPQFKKKRAVLGVFADWDCKPYPSAFYPNLSDQFEWKVPVGLWRPVSLMGVPGLLVESLLVLPEVEGPSWPTNAFAEGAESAYARVRLRVRNLLQHPVAIPLEVRIAPFNFTPFSGGGAQAKLQLPASGSGQIDLPIRISKPRLWFPWTHGAANLYQAEVSLRVHSEAGDEELRLTRVFGLRVIRAAIESGSWSWELNGRRIYPRGSNYISDFYLDRTDMARISEDLKLARDLNLDLLRVHAHIEPQEFYRAADEAGQLLISDFPLQWAYAYDLPEAEDERFHHQVWRQVGQMIELLGSSPAIGLWCMHNEPPWLESASFLGADVHESATNRELDEGSVQRAAITDPSRPAIPASGDLDVHLYHGWYTGSWTDNRDLEPAFPSEFGVQALPNLTSPVWDSIGRRWPVGPVDAAWAHADFQSPFWVSPGVGAPTRFGSLADYIKDSQDYQAFYLRHVVDQWRRQKFAPTGGYVQFMLTDCWPGITWSVADYARRRKRGFAALQEASSPVGLCVDLEPSFEIVRGHHIYFERGAEFHADLYLVNDDYRERGEVTMSWRLHRDASLPLRFVRALIGRRGARGRTEVLLPDASEPARRVASVRAHLRWRGRYIFQTVVRRGNEVLSRYQLHFNVGRPILGTRAPRRVPRFVVDRVYRRGSLRRTEDGVAFDLHNTVMAVALEAVEDVRVNGERLDLHQIELSVEGIRRSLEEVTPETPLILHAGEDLTVRLLEYPLRPGSHELELTAHFARFGDFNVSVEDVLPPD